MSEFHFLRPGFFYLMIPLLLLLVALWRRKRGQGGWGKVCDKHLLPYILKGEVSRTLLPFAFLLITSVLGIIALAGPTWTRVSLPVVEEKSGLVIALDLSPAMNSEDLKPSRLKRALYKVDDILKKRREGQTALVVYTDEAFVVTPLTDDTRTISALLNVLDTTIMPTEGLNPEKAIAKSTDLLKQGGINKGSILLITASSQTFSDPGMPVSILGVGTEQGAPVPKKAGGFRLDTNGGVIIDKLEKAKLKKMAEATGGRFALISADESDITYLLRPTREGYDVKDSQSHWQWLDSGYWLVLFCLPFAAYLFRRGSLTLAMLLFTCQLQAGLWKTNDQWGQQLFEKGQFEEAAEVFEDPQWKAAAYYKAKNYQAAAEIYEQDTSAEGYYNLGNSLAMREFIDEAIVAYKKALEIDPNHEDAAYNKKKLEEKKQDPQDKDQDKKENQQNSDQDKNDDQDKNGEQDKNEDQKEPEISEEDKEDYKQQMDEEMENQPQEEQQPQMAEGDPQKEIDDRWLERIPDDPGGLLRRKFLYQYNKGKS